MNVDREIEIRARMVRERHAGIARALERRARIVRLFLVVAGVRHGDLLAPLVQMHRGFAQ